MYSQTCELVTHVCLQCAKIIAPDRNRLPTVLPGKSDSDVMFCLNSNQDLELIDRLCINSIHRIGLIHK